MTDWELRVRAVAAEYFSTIVVVLVVVGLLGGYATYGAYATDHTRTETRTVASWESTGEFSHRATVVNGTEPFPEGTVLRDRSVYFRLNTPRLNGSFNYTYTASSGGDISADGSLALVLRSVEDDPEGNATVYWESERSLGNASDGSLDSGETMTVPFSTNVSAAAARASRIEEQFGGTPGTTEVVLRARLDVAGTRNGERVDRTRTYRLPISIQESVYRVQGSGASTASGQQTDQVQVQATPGALQRLGGPLLLVIAVLGLGGLVVGRLRGQLSVSESDRAWLAYRRQYAELDEWITTGRLPDGKLDDPRVEVESLEGLVDVAIDTDERVIEDTERDRFVVLGDEATYIYATPSRPDQFELLEPTMPGPGAVTDSDRTDGHRPDDTDETATADEDAEAAEPPEGDVSR